MKKSHSIARTALAYATIAILGACSNSGSQLGPAPSSLTPQNTQNFRLTMQSRGLAPLFGLRTGIRAHQGRSWMSPAAKSSNLLYISNPDPANQAVFVFSYPRGQLVGTLTGIGYPQGECVDAAGNVFITSLQAQGIYEFAHGGTTPINTLTDPTAGDPEGCSVDPTTGNLAVTNFYGPGGVGQGDVLVYPNATGTPVQYQPVNIYHLSYPAYDNAGNLFVDGVDQNFLNPSLAELAHGGSAFATVALTPPIQLAGNVQWDGKFLAVGGGNAQQGAFISRFVVSNGKGYLIGTTPLTGISQLAGFLDEFWIRGKRVVGPDILEGVVLSWNYPAGGSPIKAITGLSYPYAATVSKGP